MLTTRKAITSLIQISMQDTLNINIIFRSIPPLQIYSCDKLAGNLLSCILRISRYIFRNCEKKKTREKLLPDTPIIGKNIQNDYFEKLPFKVAYIHV